jgi:hypothetical protein
MAAADSAITMEQPEKVLFSHEDVVRDIPQAGIYEAMRGGVTESRNTVRIAPQQSISVAPNQTIQFKLPEDAWTDMQKAYFSFDFSYTSITGAEASPAGTSLTPYTAHLFAPLVNAGVATLANGSSGADIGQIEIGGASGKFSAAPDLNTYADLKTRLRLSLYAADIDFSKPLHLYIARGLNAPYEKANITRVTISQQNGLNLVYTDFGGDAFTAGHKVALLYTPLNNFDTGSANYGRFDNFFHCLQNGAVSLIDTLRVRQSGFLPEEIQGSSELHRAMSELLLDNDWKDTDGNCQGYFSQKCKFSTILNYNVTTANELVIVMNTTLTIRPFCSGLWQPYYLPTTMAKSFFIELVFSQAQKSLFKHCPVSEGAPLTYANDGTSFAPFTQHTVGSWQINNMYLYVDTLRPFAFYAKAIEAQFMRGMLRLNMPTWKRHLLNPKGSASTLTIHENANSISHILLMFQNQNHDTLNILTDSGIGRSNSLLRDTADTFDNFGNPSNGAVSRAFDYTAAVRRLQWKVGNFNYPQDYIEHIISKQGNSLQKSAQSKVWCLQALEKYAADNAYWAAAQKPTSISDQRWYGYCADQHNRLSLWNNRAAHPLEIPALIPQTECTEPEAFYFLTCFERDKGLLSGINTNRNQVDIQLYCEFTQPVDGVQILAYVRYDQVVQFDPNGSISIFK